MKAEAGADLEAVDGVGDVGEHVGLRHSGHKAVADLGKWRGKVGRKRVSIDRDVLHNFTRCSVEVRAGDLDGDGGSIQCASVRAIVFDYYLAHAGGSITGAVALREE